MNLLLFQTWTDEQMQAQMEAADWGQTVYLVPIAMWLVAGVALLAIIWSAINMFKNPAGIKKFALGVLILGVLLALSYFVFSNNNVPENLDGMVGPGVYHWVGAGITLTGILIGIGLLILVVDLIRGIFKI